MNVNSTYVSRKIPVWNPNSIANWSLLLSPIFGAWMSYLNWKALGETDRATASKYWLTGSISWIVSGTLVICITDSLVYRIGVVAGYVLMLLVWYWAENRNQNSYITSRLGGKYPRRSWFKPLAIALSIFLICQFAFWGVYASKLSSAPKCAYEHTVGSMADYRTESWNYCW